MARLLCVAALFLSLAGPAMAASSLAGIWSTAPVKDPEPVARLVLARSPGGPRAQLDGRWVRAAQSGDYFDFDFGPKVGTLRVRPEALGGTEITGFWIQPRLDPIYAYRFSSPVHLVPVQGGRWQGEARPLQATAAMQFVLESAPEGGDRAFIREAGRNIGRGRMFRVDQQGDALTFTNLRDANDVIQARLDPGKNGFSAFIPEFGQTLRFAKGSASNAPGFLPRPPTALPYAYAPPRVGKDGWAAADAAAEGLDVALLSRLVTQIADQPQDRPSAPAIHSLLIAYRGKLVLEEYFHGFDGRPHDVRSAGKTLTPMLVGAARDHGVALSDDTPVYPLMKRRYPSLAANPMAATMTLGDLMSMRSGYACDDNDPAMPGNEENLGDDQPDWTLKILQLPSVSRPGEDPSVYCSVDIHLAAAVASAQAGMWLPDMFDRWIARPLDFQPYYWNLTPTGEGYGGGGAFIRPRDMLKIGQAHLSGGVWNGRRVLARDWVETATRRRSTYAPATPDPAAPPRPPVASDHHGYGYGWHLYSIPVGERAYPAYVATGNGGQLVIVVPELQLVVGFSGGNYNNYRTWIQWMDRLVPEFIIPAVAPDQHRPS